MTTFALLHKLWTKAVGTAGYDKREWQALEARIVDLERRKSERRKP